eukprot:1149625-Pelagomonas_calceolata.AAC.1
MGPVTGGPVHRTLLAHVLASRFCERQHTLMWGLGERLSGEATALPAPGTSASAPDKFKHLAAHLGRAP